MRMDGASDWQTLWQLAFPLTKPALVTVTIYNGLGIWNGFLLPLVLTQSPEKRLLPLGLCDVPGPVQRERAGDPGLGRADHPADPGALHDRSASADERSHRRLQQVVPVPVPAVPPAGTGLRGCPQAARARARSSGQRPTIPRRHTRSTERSSKMPVELHVRTSAADGADGPEGSEQRPFTSIDAAAQVAQPGDTVVVHDGVYREWVSPRFSGPQRHPPHHLHRRARRAPGDQGLRGRHGLAPGRGPGVDRRRAEHRLRRLQPLRRGARRRLGRLRRRRPPPRSTSGTSTSTARASTRSPRATPWSTRRCAPRSSTTGPRPPTACATPSRPGSCGSPRWARRRRRSRRTSPAPTPNAELVEINVRRSVFYPREHHVDYITVRGFELAQAATPWAPPTADQPGLVGPNWAKGWVIEDNVIHDAKCSADLDRQGDLDRPQLRHAARRQAGLPVPAGVGLHRRADRLGPRAHRLAPDPAQHDLRLRPERHRRPPRLRVLDHRGQPHLQHRDQARVLRLRDRRRSSSTPRSTSSSGTTGSTTARSAPGSTGRPRAPG